MSKLITFILLISLDIVSKKIIFTYIDLYSFIPILPFFDLTHIHNFGVSFGLLSGEVSSWLLILVGLLVVSFIYYLMISSKDFLERWGLFVIIVGALANIVDRIINGYVIDFIYFHLEVFDWPAFNFADIYITIGIIMIIVSVFKNLKFPKR